MLNYLSQNSQDILIPSPGILKDGTQATTLAINSFTVAIANTDGTLLSNYTIPAITNPLSNGNYIFNFQTSANSPTFINVNSGNPYVFTMDHPETDVEPWGPIPVNITDRLQGDLARTTEVSSNLTAVQSLITQVVSLETRVSSIGVEVGSNSTAISSLQASVNSLETVTNTVTNVINQTSIEEGMPRIEAGDTFQFIKDWITVPNSVQINIFHRSSETIVTSGAVATQSGTSANFYYFHTTNVASGFTTVNSNGIYVIEWIAYRTTGNDRFNEYFEVIRTDG